MPDNNPWADWVQREDAKPTSPPKRTEPLRERKPRPGLVEPTEPRLVLSTLRAMREFTNWTIRDVAEESGLSYAYVHKLFEGHRNPQGEDLAKLAMSLSVKPEWLHLEEPISYETRKAWLDELQAATRDELLALRATKPGKYPKATSAELIPIGNRLGVHCSTVASWWRAIDAEGRPQVPKLVPKPIPSAETLAKLFRIDLESPSGLVRASGEYEGEIAGDPSKFVACRWIVRVGGGRFPSAQLVWCLRTGTPPAGLVTFLDGDGANYSECNLVEVA